MLKFSGFANLTSCLESLANDAPNQGDSKTSRRDERNNVSATRLASWLTQQGLVDPMPQERLENN